MRLIDFLEDLRQTSARIAERGARIDVDAAAGLTARTLMRPDTIAYFDWLRAEAGVQLSNAEAILFYAAMFALLVNARPRLNAAEALALSARMARRLSGLPHDGEAVLCRPRTVAKPQAVFSRINRLLNRPVHGGLYCVYLPAPPSPDVVAAHCGDASRDASLFLYASAGEDRDVAPQVRIRYHAPLFVTPDRTIGCLYVGASQ